MKSAILAVRASRRSPKESDARMDATLEVLPFLGCRFTPKTGPQLRIHRAKVLMDLAVALDRVGEFSGKILLRTLCSMSPDDRLKLLGQIAALTTDLDLFQLTVTSAAGNVVERTSRVAPDFAADFGLSTWRTPAKQRLAKRSCSREVAQGRLPRARRDSVLD